MFLEMLDTVREKNESYARAVKRFFAQAFQMRENLKYRKPTAPCSASSLLTNINSVLIMNIKTYAFLGCLLLASTFAQAQYVLQPLATFGTNGDGTVRVNEQPYLVYDTNAPNADDRSTTMQRGIAYNPTTGHLLVANRYPIASPSVHIVDANTGEPLGTLQGWTQVGGGHAEFPINLVGVADDGTIYVGNLSTQPNPPEFILYRWESEADTSPDYVFFGGLKDLTAGVAGANLRWGDNMAVRGSGMNTEILLSSRGTQFAILRPSVSDLSDFTNITFNVSLPIDALGACVTFGPGNTFFAKDASSDGHPLYQIAFDYTTGAATVSNVWQTYEFPGRTSALHYNAASNMLATVEPTAGARPDRVRIYDVSNLTVPPVLLDRVDVGPWTNILNLFEGAVAWGTNGTIYSLDIENGIAALTPVAGTASLPVAIHQQPVGKLLQMTSNYVFTVGADGLTPISYQWFQNSNELVGATGPTLSLNNLQVTNDGWYHAVVSNSLGAATSSVAKLTVVPRFGDLVVYDPFDYSVGSQLTNLAESGWSRTGTAENGQVEAGNLDVPGLRPSLGNRYTLTGNTSVRKPFGEYSSGQVYFSFAFRIDNPGTSTGSETMAGLSYGTSTAFPVKINLQGDGAGNYQVGLYKRGGTTFGALDTSHTFTSADTVFIVARLTYADGITNDLCDMWVNPSSSTFGAETPPPATVANVGAGQTDDPFIDRFFMRWASGYPKRTYDEVRVGFSWAEVTPPAPPVVSIVQSGANVVLSWPENQTGFSLEGRVGLDDADGWLPVNEPVVVQGGNNTVTVPAGGTTKFFRLNKQ